MSNIHSDCGRETKLKIQGYGLRHVDRHIELDYGVAEGGMRYYVYGFWKSIWVSSYGKENRDKGGTEGGSENLDSDTKPYLISMQSVSNSSLFRDG